MLNSSIDNVVETYIYKIVDSNSIHSIYSFLRKEILLIKFLHQKNTCFVGIKQKRET